MGAAPSPDSSSTHRIPATRLIFKNLPKYLTSDGLSKHISQHLSQPATDCRVLYAPTGDKRSRRFAFVGFSTSKEANRARSYFDGTFIHTCRIRVEEVKAEYRAWSKYTRASPGLVGEPSPSACVLGSSSVNNSGSSGIRAAPASPSAFPTSSSTVTPPGDTWAAKKPSSKEFEKKGFPHSSASSHVLHDEVGRAPAQRGGGGGLLDGSQLTSDERDNTHDDSGSFSHTSRVRSVQRDAVGAKKAGMSSVRTHVVFEDEEFEDEDLMASTSSSASLYASSLHPDMQWLQNKTGKNLVKKGLSTEAVSLEATEGVQKEVRGQHRSESSSFDVEDYFSSQKKQQKEKQLKQHHQISSSIESSATPSIGDAENPLKYVGAKAETKRLSSSSAPSSMPISGATQHYSKEEEGAMRLLSDEGRLMLLNIPYNVTEDNIRALCKPFGELGEITLPLDPETGKSRGFAFVSWMFPEHAVKALASLSATPAFMGRRLFARPARSRDSRLDDGKKGEVLKGSASYGGEDGVDVFGNGKLRGSLGADKSSNSHLTEKEGDRVSRSSYKARKEKIMRENAENLTHTWNLLYVSANSAADSVAAQLGLEKTDILDLNSRDSLAVRVALSESFLVKQTNEWLKKEGIRAGAFEYVGKDLLSSLPVDSVERFSSQSTHALEEGASLRGGAMDGVSGGPDHSQAAALSGGVFCADDTIIVKHLPSLPGMATEELLTELRSMFRGCGELARFCLAPSRLLAIVQYCEPSAAKAAFKKFALRRYRDVPLYLEWARKDTFVASEHGEDGERGGAREAETGEIGKTSGGGGNAEKSGFNESNSDPHAHQTVIKHVDGKAAVSNSSKATSQAVDGGMETSRKGGSAISKGREDVKLRMTPAEKLESAAESTLSLVNSSDFANASSKQQAFWGESDEETASSSPTHSLFVKNLAFSTTKTALEEAFLACEGFRSATIMMKTKGISPSNANNPTHTGDELKSKKEASSLSIPNNNQSSSIMLSMGYGFLEFKDAVSAKEALRRHQGLMLDGHSLILSLAHTARHGQEITVKNQRKGSLSSSSRLPNSSKRSGGGEGVSSSSVDHLKYEEVSNKRGDGEDRAPSKKFILKNLPFQASKKEVLELVSAFGSVCAVRMPKKPDGSSNRGYAFVEFLTHSDLKNAKEALQHTHFYGRHLVIQESHDEEAGGVTSVASAIKRAQVDSNRLASRSNAEMRKKRKILEDEGEERGENEF